jgi:hypothetical protein
MIDIIFGGAIGIALIVSFCRDKVTEYIRSRRVHPEINIIIPDDNTYSMVSQDDDSIVD